MFWKRKQPATISTKAKPQATRAEAQKPQRARKLSPKEIFANQIEQLKPGQSLSYRLPKIYGGDLAIVELNSRYPEKGKKYTMSMEALVDGKPGGEKTRLWDNDNPKAMATWIVDRQGELFS